MRWIILIRCVYAHNWHADMLSPYREIDFVQIYSS